ARRLLRDEGAAVAVLRRQVAGDVAKLGRKILMNKENVHDRPSCVGWISQQLPGTQVLVPSSLSFCLLPFLLCILYSHFPGRPQRLAQAAGSTRSGRARTRSGCSGSSCQGALQSRKCPAAEAAGVVSWSAAQGWCAWRHPSNPTLRNTGSSGPLRR